MDEENRPDDTLRERADEGKWRLWLVMNADRRVVAGVLLLSVFLTLLIAGAAYPGAEVTLRETDSVDTMFQGLLTATITGVTLVLTLNQLVLSQELGAVGDQRDRMDGAITFHRDAADVLNTTVAPAQPAQFLGSFVRTAGEQAETLRENAPDGEAGEAIESLTESIIGNADSVAEDLDGASFGEFDVVSGALDFNYSWKVYETQRIDAEFGDQLDSETSDQLDSLRRTLTLFGPAREHFKTLYFQWELTALSRTILTAAIPALVVSLFMVAYFNVATFEATVLGFDGLVFVFALGATIGLVPFAILLSYVLRIATVTKHTLSIGPFILRGTDD